ncbi:histidine kinase [Streptomyces sp. NBC_01754]|uniref:sensor histidine kinase n=1 Tax=Streptomyces sp. NBC_01754 TaxID=2975930 RepID=UPI002DD7D278|nr:histidine kinase [Streptomyces sp. NBC_01754]WSC95551.1 histidine kinase [Streptomyces sp. NBC_01754]
MSDLHDRALGPAEGGAGAGGNGPDGVPGRSRDLPAPRLARAILLAALLSYLAITVINILSTELGPLATATAFAGLASIFALQLGHSRAGANRAPLGRRSLTLGAQCLLTYLPLVTFHAQWGAMAGFLAGSLLLLLPPRVAWPLYALVGLSMLLPPVLEGRPLVDSVYLCQTTLLTGVVVYGLSRLAELIRILHETRDELARMAVSKERLRFARDLHDLLGYSLSAITLKSELIHRLITVHPARATTEIEDVLAISREALADVRTVASGYRDMSLRDELASARSVLNAAAVEVRADVRLGTVSRPVDTVLAAVLREAVTNLLRHSKAEHCDITAVQERGRVRLSITNDGADPDYHDPSPDSGTGLGNLSLRLASVDGRLVSERGSDGTFRLAVEAPAQHDGIVSETH